MTRELIALAVTRQSDGCITVHTDAAVKLGATQEEVAEALGVKFKLFRRQSSMQDRHINPHEKEIP